MTRFIEKFDKIDQSQFDHLISQNQPFVILKENFGNCIHNWDNDYLLNKIGNYPVKVHVSDEPILNFLDKNFRYETYNFGEFIHQCSHDEKQYLYLRSIGMDKRGKDVSNIKKHFPQIADDIAFPEFANFCKSIDCNSNVCEKKHIFSSVFRISSPGLVMWTHYDIVDNILLQVRGSKKVILFPPSDATYLYLRGDKSEIVDVDQVDEEKYPLFKHTTRYECTLSHGEAIFIPSLWFHSTRALDFSIGINFFWKDKQLSEYYQKSDVYGNKDLIPACDAYANVDKALKHLSKLPTKYKLFYMNMIISKLNNEMSNE